MQCRSPRPWGFHDGLSTLEASRQLGITQATLWRWMEEVRLPYYRIGEKLLRVRQADLDAFVESCRVQPGTLGSR